MPRRRAAHPAAATDWWATYFDDEYLVEFAPLFTPDGDRHEVAALLDALALPVGGRLLDVPCGQGRHAHLLAEQGYDVTGLDYSRPLLARAKARGTGPRLRYVRGDMRALPARWTGRFDAVCNLFTSFGFFGDPADDARTIAEFARVLAPGGLLAWHGGNRDGVMAKFVARDAWTSRGRVRVEHERSFEPLEGILTIRTTLRRGRTAAMRTHRIRLYTPTRLAELCAAAGLVVERALDGWSGKPVHRRSPELLLIARKPARKPAR